MAGTQRFALWLLAPVNAVALLAGLAVAHGTVPLPEQQRPLSAAAPVALPEQPLPLLGASAAVEVRPQLLPSRAPVAKPTPLRKTAASRPAKRRTRHVSVPRLSFEKEVQRQVARIPLYRPGIARWEIVPDLAVYGVTRLRTRTVYLSPRIPRKLLYSVVAHEWGHVISTYAYGGDLRVSQLAFKDWFGGGSMGTATERAADCIAVLLGATWTHYTACHDEHWRLGALYLANGMQLPTES
jgi:hypothetical protein